MGSSSVKRPFSTHCSAATVVMSFVQDAAHMTASSCRAGALSSTLVVPMATMWGSPSGG